MQIEDLCEICYVIWENHYTNEYIFLVYGKYICTNTNVLYVLYVCTNTKYKCTISTLVVPLTFFWTAQDYCA